MTDERFRTGGALDALPNMADTLTERLAGRVLSGYRIEELIGSGGMGFVFRGIRAGGDFQRSAAIKVVPGSLGSAELRQRFRTEVQILARLNHPCIAQLYDAGETEEGWPYLVMEYVDGSPVDRYCASHSLDMDDRLQLLIDVSKAIRFAHARLIVHRDLKPSNVIVDRDGRLKLLDFGIAKLLEPGTPEQTVGHRPMTPQYASPEQLLGADITIGSDIYQLGLLFLIITAGETPFESMTLQDAIRAAAAGQDAAISERAARAVPADLLAIIVRCLHSHPEDRYPDVNALLTDLLRFRDGFPVEARKGSHLYRLRKLVQRNVPATVVAVLAGIVTLGGSVYYTINISEARRVAEQRAETANRVLTALSSLVTETFEGFIDQNADRQTGTAAVIESVLEDTVGLLGEALTDEPAARGELLRVQGGIEQALGDYLGAAGSFDEAAALTSPQENPEGYILARLARADVALRTDDVETARRIVREIEPLLAGNRISPATAVEFLHVSGYLATRENRYADALATLEEAIRQARSRQPPDARALAELFTTKMQVHELQQDYEGVLAAASNALDYLGQTESAFSSKRVQPLRLTARAHVLLGDLAAASDALDEAMSIARGNFGDAHRLVADVHHTFGLLKYYAKDLAGAVGHVEQEIEILTALYGADHRSVTDLTGNLGVLYTDIGETEKAGEMLRRERASLDPEAPEDRHAWYSNTTNEARRLRAIGDYERAIEFEQESLAIRVELYGPDSILVADAEDDIALALYNLGRYEEAREWFLRSVEKYRAEFGEDSEEYRNKLLYFWRYDLIDGELVAARDKLHEIMMEDVEKGEVDAIWPVHMFTDLAHINLRLGDLARAEQALAWAKTGAATAPRHPWALYTDLVDAEIGLARGDYERARRYAEKALAGMRERFPAHTRRMERARAVLAALPQTG